MLSELYSELYSEQYQRLFRYCSDRKSSGHFDPLILGWVSATQPTLLYRSSAQNEHLKSSYPFDNLKSLQKYAFGTISKSFGIMSVFLWYCSEALFRKVKMVVVAATTTRIKWSFWPLENENRLDIACPAYTHRALLYPLSPRYTPLQKGITEMVRVSATRTKIKWRNSPLEMIVCNHFFSLSRFFFHSSNSFIWFSSS